ncbi:MAG TPA: CBS domain-containing protein, partial [Desulfobacteraceae bacterium]|nr:CBS domain-containing protein [Desulfobacteraceae bacterium]
FCVNPRSGESRIADIMSSPLITIDAGTSLGRAADLMAEKKIRRLLVTEDDMIKGIVTERDIMRATLYVFKTLSDAWI